MLFRALCYLVTPAHAHSKLNIAQLEKFDVIKKLLGSCSVSFAAAWGSTQLLNEI